MDLYSDIIVSEEATAFDLSPERVNPSKRRKKEEMADKGDESTAMKEVDNKTEDKGGNKVEKEIIGLRSDFNVMMDKMNKVLDMMERVEALSVKVDKNVGMIKRVEDCVKDNSEDIVDMKKTTDAFQTRLETLEKRVMGQEEKSVDLEARGRRNNLIFHGVKEEDREDCMKIVKGLIKKECKVSAHVEIERAHRLGSKRQDAEKPRPLIVRFLDFKDKMEVKEGRVNLPHGLGISEDLPFAIRQDRRRLHDDLDKAKRDGKTACIS